MRKHPPGGCYPQGLEPTRRRFLRALASATAALAVPRTGLGLPGQEATETVDATDIPGAYPEGAVRLDFNENPLGPSPKAIEAILADRLSEANRYNNIAPLTQALAQHHGVPEKQILLGCGSTEFLHIAPWTFLNPLRGGGSLVLPEPTYGWSANVAEAMGANVVRVPLGALGRIDPKAFRETFTRDTRLVYIANPNNPTGASLFHEEVERLAESMPHEAVLLVDEAYCPFLPPGKTAVDLAAKGAPVIVARTFSKAYGLAGLRLGYAIAPQELAEKLKTFWLWDLGINAAVNVAGPAALADDSHVRAYVRTVDEGLEWLRSELSAMGLQPFPHRAPFFMVDLGREAKPVVAALNEKRIYVRDGSAWGMPTFLRISIGRDQENRAFLDALRGLL